MQQQTQQQTEFNLSDIAWEIPALGGLLGLLILVWVVSEFSGFMKGQQIGRARWASRSERRNAQKKAYQQMLSTNLADTALWINTPKNTELINGKLFLPESKKSLKIPDISQSVGIWGAANAGKSYSVFDRLKFSAIYQGHSIIDFDAKANEVEPPSNTTAGLAMKLGYKVYIIDTSGNDTDTINAWDTLSSPTDTDSAYNLADAFIANMSETKPGNENEFFRQAAGTLLAAVILMVKNLPREYQDFATVSKILSLTRLIDRVKANLDKMSEYVKGIWAQYLSQDENPETAQSITGSLQNTLSRLFTPQIMAVFRGDGNCPVILHGRTMVVFRLNTLKKNHKPIIGAVLSMMFRLSVTAKERKNPVGLLQDEAPQLRVNELAQILILSRSMGGYAILAAQSIASLKQAFGAEEVESLLAALKTTIFGGLTSKDDSTYFADMIAKEQVNLKNKSRSRGRNHSFTNSESAQASYVLEPHEIRGLRQGEFAFLCPKVGRNRGYVPFKVQIKVSKHERSLITDGKNAFKQLRKSKKPKSLTEEELQTREAIAYDLLPLPLEIEQKNDEVTLIRSIL